MRVTTIAVFKGPLRLFAALPFLRFLFFVLIEPLPQKLKILEKLRRAVGVLVSCPDLPVICDVETDTFQELNEFGILGERIKRCLTSQRLLTFN